MKSRLCHARTRRNTRCRRPALPNSTTCRLHGALGGRPKGIPLRSGHVAAMVAGRRRWVEQMRLLKARGLIVKIPGGRRPGGQARPANKYIARALRVIEERIEMARKTMPEAPANPGAERPIGNGNAVVPASRLTLAEDFMHAGGMALQRAKDLLATEIDFGKLADSDWLRDAENRKAAMIVLKLAASQATVALSLIANQLEAGVKLRSRALESVERDRVLGEMARDLREDPS